MSVGVFPQFVFGYHGCDRDSVGIPVLTGEKTLKFSHNYYDWLGEGIYFWENAPYRAMEWARSCQKNPKQTAGRIKNPFVLGAIIELGNCLNLTDLKQMDVLKEAFNIIEVSFKQKNWSLPKNDETKRALDCMVINTAVEMNKEKDYQGFDSVRGAYIEGEPVYPGACIQEKTHIQVCVRNINCIRGYFYPSEFISR